MFGATKLGVPEGVCPEKISGSVQGSPFMFDLASSLQLSSFEILTRNFDCTYLLICFFVPENKILELQGRSRGKPEIHIF
jgi:hypothetical protein